MMTLTVRLTVNFLESLSAYAACELSVVSVPLREAYRTCLAAAQRERVLRLFYPVE